VLRVESLAPLGVGRERTSPVLALELLAADVAFIRTSGLELLPSPWEPAEPAVL
jgi:hypothetical protein